MPEPRPAYPADRVEAPPTLTYPKVERRDGRLYADDRLLGGIDHPMAFKPTSAQVRELADRLAQRWIDHAAAADFLAVEERAQLDADVERLAELFQRPQDTLEEHAAFKARLRPLLERSFVKVMPAPAGGGSDEQS